MWPNGVFFPGRVGSGVRSGFRVSGRSRIHPVGDRFPKSGPNRLEPQKQAKVHLFGLFLQVFCFPHRVVVVFFVRSCMHTLGIEPRSQAWKACMMPLHYVCLKHGAPVQPHSLQQKSGLKRKTTECHPRRTATTSMSGTLRPPYQPTAVPSLLSALRGVLVLRNRFSISET